MKHNEPEYFFTVDLGELYGPKMVEAAAEASYDDVEAYAALILRYALDWLDETREADLAEATQEVEDVEIPDENASGDINDDIPF